MQRLVVLQSMPFAPRLPRHSNEPCQSRNAPPPEAQKLHQSDQAAPRRKPKAAPEPKRCAARKTKNLRQRRNAAPTRNPKNAAGAAKEQRTPITSSDNDPKSCRASIQAARCNTTLDFSGFHEAKRNESPLQGLVLRGVRRKRAS